MTTKDNLREFIDGWAAAELRGDSAFLDRVLVDDFKAVGPRGFIVDRSQWLERFAAGLHYEPFAVDDVQARLYGDLAAVIARQVQQATYNSQRSDGEFRLTLLLRAQPDGWRIAGMQLSPIMAAPAAA